MPGVSLPTVYATLELLESLGMVRRVATERGAVVYDPRTDDHHHLACRRCGAMVDVEAPVVLPELMSAARAAGFVPDHTDVVIRGLCADCAAARLGARLRDRSAATAACAVYCGEAALGRGQPLSRSRSKRARQRAREPTCGNSARSSFGTRSIS